MFCQNCGNKIEDGVRFCPACGHSSEAAPVAPTQPKGFNETTVIEVSKDTEQKTIHRYQCFGWKLQNNQEVNVTSISGGGSSYHGTGSSYVRSTTTTYVKLTFERNTGINNYAKLDELYKNFKNIQDEYRKAELALQAKDFDTRAAVITIVVCAAIGAAFGLTGGLASFFGLFGMIYPALMGALVGILPGAIIGAISGKKKKNALKKQLQPKMAEMEGQMDTLANEAREYLQ